MIKRLIKKALIKAERILFLNQIKRNIPKRKSIRKIGILVKINPNSKKFNLWHDGFTAAINILRSDYDKIEYLSFDKKNTRVLIEKINQHDLLLVKSGWKTDIDYWLRKNSKSITTPLGLVISSSNYGPSLKEQLFYDIVWYETKWYKNKSVKHPNAYHGFGVDTSVMSKANREKKYDWICVGAPRSYKRIEKLLEKRGRRLLIGDLENKDAKSNKLLKKLKEDDVEIRNFTSYTNLAELYNESKNCLIPCKLHGGGERSLLEARACGVSIEINENNPKLAELMESAIWNHEYYSKQLKKGIKTLTNENSASRA